MIDETILVALVFLSAAIGTALGIFCIRRSSERGAFYLALLLFSASWWSFFYGLELLSVEQSARNFWYAVGILGNAPLAASALLFSLDFCGYAVARNKLFVALIAVEPLAHLALTLTNQWHRLVWSDIHPVSYGTITLTGRHWGVWYAFDELFGVLQVAAAIYILGRLMARSAALFKRQLLGILLAIGLTAGLRAAFSLASGPVQGFDFTHIAFVIAGAGVALSFFRFGMFAILPAAREAVVESMKDGIFIIDSHGHLVDANSVARIALRGSRKKTLGLKAQDALLPGVWDALERTRNHNEAAEIQLQDDHSYRVTVSDITYGTGIGSGEIVSLRDVTGDILVREAQQEATRLAEEGAKAQSEFLANVSHELRTPMHMILGFADALKDSASSSLSDSQEEFVDEIEGAGRLLLELINIVVELTKLDTNKRPVEKMDFDLAEICSELAVRLEHRDGHEVKVHKPDEEVRVNSDMGMVTEIIERLTHSVNREEAGRLEVLFVVKSGRETGDASVGAAPSVLVFVAAERTRTHPFQRMVTAAQDGGEVPAGSDLRTWLEFRLAWRLANHIGARLETDHSQGGGIALVFDD